jgi:DNA-directed RNA polymerase subunit RPC12/RpoP
MTSDYSKELLRNGIIDAKAKQFDSARHYLDRAIYMAGSHEVLAEAWFWMSEVLGDVNEKRKALENCLSNDFHHTRARRSLAILDGKLKADDVIDPNQLPSAPQGLRDADAQRFMCPKCGARMAFSPDGAGLVCDYCTSARVLGVGKIQEEKDFLIAMATMKGHGKPLQEQGFHCNGCGAEFILPPKQISASCAYCDSPHVVSLENTKDLLAPDAILPFAFDNKRAIKYLVDWVEKNEIKPEKKVDLPRGLYLPLWTFDIGGSIEYTGEMIVQNDNEFEEFSNQSRQKIVQIKDEYPVFVDDYPIPASRKLSSVFHELIPTFNLKELKPYDPRFLSSWLAEIYDVPMANASLDARSLAYKKFKDELPTLIHDINIVHSSSAKIMVESFKLNLLPVWMTEIPFGGREHLVLINGQNGFVESDLELGKESGGLLSWLGDLLED